MFAFKVIHNLLPFKSEDFDYTNFLIALGFHYLYKKPYILNELAALLGSIYRQNGMLNQ